MLEVFLSHTIFIRRGIGELPSTLGKNKNNIDISICQIYLLKFLENIFKYYWLNLFKEIAIRFNHGLQMTPESSASLSYGLLL